MKKTLFIIATICSSFLICGYSRSDYKHWIDADGDCQNTRQEILIKESIEDVKLSKNGCTVIEGKWYDSYTNQYFTNPKELDIDHMVPLAEADRSGGNKWSSEKKMEYANDINLVLIPVSKSANRSKGDKDPSDWMPSNKNYRCEYLRRWVDIKKKWELNMDDKEALFIQSNKDCFAE